VPDLFFPLAGWLLAFPVVPHRFAAEERKDPALGLETGKSFENLRPCGHPTPKSEIAERMSRLPGRTNEGVVARESKPRNRKV
jgi:hypothetical protein